MKKIIIVDGNAILHRAWHALPPTLTKKDGTIVNAVYGFFSIFFRVLNELKPKYVVVAWDTAAKTKRAEKYEEYKATRVAKEQELYDQIPIIQNSLRVFHVPSLMMDGYEADDVIGTLVKKVEKEKNIEAIIVTGDMDALQLVDNFTKVYALKRGITDVKIYDEDGVKKRYGITPRQVIDLKALMGDSSDNIKGVKGIGEKTAQKLISEYGSLDNLYSSIEEKKEVEGIKPAQLQKLQQGKEDAYLSKELVTIDREVPIEFKLEDAEFGNYDMAEVMDVFNELEFKSLLNRIPTPSNQSEQILECVKNVNYQYIKEKTDCERLVENLKKQKIFSFDTETTGVQPFLDWVLGISISYKEGEAYYIHFSAVTDGLKQVFADEQIKKVAHNAKFDIEFLEGCGFEVNGLVFDTKIAAYLLNPGTRTHSLKDLAFREFGVQMMTLPQLLGSGKNALSMEELAEQKAEELADYAAADADYTWRLYPLLEKRLKEEGLFKIYQEIELPLVKVLADMEHQGVVIDKKELERQSQNLSEKIESIQKEIYDLSGERFNIASPKQLKNILFDKLGLPTQGIKSTKTGYSTAASELEKLAPFHPIVALIGDFREYSKLKNTYLDTLPQLINQKSGRVHTNFNQTVTATGRLSSSDPNLQNIPIRTEIGRQIRKAFVSPDGYKLVASDYSQIELRLVANLADDQTMINAFINGEDIHRRTAAAIFGVDYTDVTNDQRYAAKAINFGVIYGQGPFGLSQTAKISMSEAKNFIDTYFKKYAAVKKFLDKMKDDAHKNEYAASLFGRKRYIPEINSSVQVVRSSAERIAINMPVQGTAADILKMAMIEVFGFIKKTYKPDEVKMLLTVHDELVFEVRDDLVDEFTEKLDRLMEHPRGLDLKVPIKADTEVGKNWGEMEKVA